MQQNTPEATSEDVEGLQGWLTLKLQMIVRKISMPGLAESWLFTHTSMKQSMVKGHVCSQQCFKTLNQHIL